MCFYHGIWESPCARRTARRGLKTMGKKRTAGGKEKLAPRRDERML